MKKNKLLIILLGIVVVALVVLGVLFATGKLSSKKDTVKEEDTGWRFPTDDGYTVVLDYGEYEVLGIKEWSPGIDITKGEGSNIYAAKAGKIVTKDSEGGAYGKYIMIDHNNGYYTLYAHLKDFAPGIEEGTTVSKGQVIGYMGRTGYATGIYLHFEVRNCPEYSCTIDPMTLLK